MRWSGVRGKRVVVTVHEMSVVCGLFVRCVARDGAGRWLDATDCCESGRGQWWGQWCVQLFPCRSASAGW
jgi:hypothetical protein